MLPPKYPVTVTSKTQSKRKANGKETPVLYLTDKSIQNLDYRIGLDAGYYDILQLPAPKELFLNKIEILIQFQRLQHHSQYVLI